MKGGRLVDPRAQFGGEAVAVGGGNEVLVDAHQIDSQVILQKLEVVAADGRVDRQGGEDRLQVGLDLADLLIKNPPATYMLRVSGRSMEEMNIHDGDFLVVDRSLDPQTGDVVIAYLDGDLTVKQLGMLRGHPVLIAASENYPPIHVKAGQDFQIWGVVSHVIHTLHRNGRKR